MSEVQAEEPWEERLLCPDGGCIGVLDARGRCPVCGRTDPAAVAAPRRRGAEPSAEPPDESPAKSPDERPDESPDATAPVATSERDDGDHGEAWQTRQLCDDGACIGVIVEGRCNTCGKAPAT